MRQKLYAIIATILIASTLTGCEQIDKITAKFKVQDIAKDIAHDNQYAMTAETKKKQGSYIAAAEQYNRAMNRTVEDTPPKNWPLVGGLVDLTLKPVKLDAKSRIAKDKATTQKNLDSAKSNYEFAKATDNAFLASSGQESDRKTNRLFKYLIPLAIVVAILILLILWLKRPKVAKATPAAPAPAMASHSASEVYGRKTEKAVRDYCKKHNIDADALYQQHGSWEAASSAMWDVEE